MLDLLIINPGGSKKKVYQELSDSFSAIEPPFWAALTAGYISNKGFNVKILDANAENLDYDEVCDRITKYNPYLINIAVFGQHPSASTQLMTSVIKLCDRIKYRNIHDKIILTGLHPSSLPRETLSCCQCDFVCQGEGFETILGLLNVNYHSNIPGLCWRNQDNEIEINERAKLIENLYFELYRVAWELLPFNKGLYRAHNWHCFGNLSSRNKYASLSTSLGCVFNCNFCSIHSFFNKRKIRSWNVNWVVNQIEYLYIHFGIINFKIIDELFLFDYKHYIGIADEIIRRGIGSQLNIWAYARVDTINKYHLLKLKRAGFKWLGIGFESGSENILKKSHKGDFTVRDMIDLRNILGDIGINVAGNFMFGFENDTYETMQQTLDLAFKLNCEYANFYCVIPWPGSDLYNNYNGRKPESWEDYAQHSYGFVPMQSKYLTSEQILEFRDNAFNSYFTSIRYLDMIEIKFGLEAKKHIQEMTKIKLKRRILGCKNDQLNQE